MGGARQVLVNLASCCRILRVQRQLFASGFFPLRKSALLCERRDGVYRCCIEVARRRARVSGTSEEAFVKGIPLPVIRATSSVRCLDRLQVLSHGPANRKLALGAQTRQAQRPATHGLCVCIEVRILSEATVKVQSLSNTQCWLWKPAGLGSCRKAISGDLVRENFS